MKISTKGRYGLRAMIELAASYGHGPLMVDTIAERQEISGNYIHVLMNSLKNAGLVRSSRGRSGGYELAMDPSQINAFDIVRALEGSLALVDCSTDKESCTRSASCETRELWAEVAGAIETVLRGHTLAELAEQQRQRIEQSGEVSYAI